MNGMIHRCTCCGFSFSFPEGSQVFECPACGTLASLPRSTGNALTLLKRANDLRLALEFIKAEEGYLRVLQESPAEHEALWGRLLCLYGVEYVEEADGRRRPVVHIVRTKPMREQADFRLACEHAPEEVRKQYEREAAYIDEAQAAIHSLNATAKPYDVFLCHKTTRPGSSEKTEDFVRALNLYHFLEKNGLRTFFAPECLQGAAGSNYEAGIYHALRTARTMLVICSDPEYVNSTWVRSEWSRFLEMADEEKGKRLIPLLYDHFPASHLPAPFTLRSLQGLDMSRLTAAQTLLDILNGLPGDVPVTDTEYHIELTFPNLRRSWKTVPGWKVFSSDKQTILGSAAWDKAVRIPLPAEHDVLWIGPVDAPQKMAQYQKRHKRLLKLLLLTAAISLLCMLMMLAHIFLIGCLALIVEAVMFCLSLRRLHRCYTCSFQAAAGKRYTLTWKQEAVSDQMKCTQQ